MRSEQNVFHLAIPCVDLDQAAQFYVDVLGACVARRYEDRVTLDFFGDQLVCHLSPEHVDPDPGIYPRHFGITFRQRDDFDTVLQTVRSRGIELFHNVETRYAGQPEEHITFFLRDPSNNVIEFKHYPNPQMMY